MIDRVIFENVSHSFAEHKIFSGLSSELNAGKVTAVTGANGSGKSTFLKIAGQFLKPDTGTVTAFEDGRIIERVDFRNKIAAVAPNMNLYSELTAVENLKFFASLRSKFLTAQNISEIFSRVNLDISTGSKAVKNFSTGMIQRLKFAVLLTVDADIWLLDEPCSNLDEVGREKFLSEIKSAASSGKLILLATNDRDEAKIANEIISLPLD